MVILKEEKLLQVVNHLQNGKVVVLPSETSYGLSCDATNQKAVDKIFKIKNREEAKSLLIVVPNIDEAKKYLEWNSSLDKLANKYWPGSLTIVNSAKKSKLAKGVVSNQGTLAMRVCALPILVEILELCQQPLVSTSANISGENPLYDHREIIRVFKDRQYIPDAILDYGLLPFNKPSTIVNVVGNKLKILRQGELVI